MTRSRTISDTRSPLSGTEILAIVASLATLVSFLFNIWQHIKLRAAKQAVLSISSITQTALLETAQIQRRTSSEVDFARHRAIAAFLAALYDVCAVFLGTRLEDIESSKKSGKGTPVYNLGDLPNRVKP